MGGSNNSADMVSISVQVCVSPLSQCVFCLDLETKLD